MSKPPKIDRKELKQPDAFVSRGQSILDWLFGHWAGVSTLLGTITLIVGSVYGYQYWNESKEETAWSSYTAAVKAAEPQRWEDLKKAANVAPDLRPGMMAAIALADHYFEEARKEALKDEKAAPGNNATLALEWYGKALQFGALLPSEKQLLTINRGNVYELMKKIDEAQADYKSASEIAGEGKPWALLNLGRAYEIKQDVTKATETYEKVSAVFANTEYSKRAKNSLRRMKSPLFTAPKAG